MVRQKAYEVFPASAGMILRTAYEQVLILELKRAQLWNPFMQTVRRYNYPTLKGIEDFAKESDNKSQIFPTDDLKAAFQSIITYHQRDFLNANIHSPGMIRVTSDSLKGIAQAGMFTLIQGLIELF